MITRMEIASALWLSVAMFVTIQIVTMPIMSFGVAEDTRTRLALVTIINLLLAGCAFGIGTGVFSLLAKKYLISRAKAAIVGVVSAFAASQIAPISNPWAFPRLVVAQAFVAALIIVAILVLLLGWILANRVASQSP
jgi:hypothetical protein